MPPDDADLDEWFESDAPDGFGGNEQFWLLFVTDHAHPSNIEPFFKGWEDSNDNLRFGVTAYIELLPHDDSDLATAFGTRDRPWRHLSQEAKERFRLGWDEYLASLPDSSQGSDEESAIPELSSIVRVGPAPAPCRKTL